MTARCVGDVRPPCYIARRTAPEAYEIVPLDPATGTAGGDVRYRGQLEDFAVHRDGERLLVVPPGGRAATLVAELGRDRPRTVAFPLTLVRSIAYGPKDEIVATGTLEPNRYEVVKWAQDAFHTVLEANGELLSLARPSPDGDANLRAGAPDTSAGSNCGS